MGDIQRERRFAIGQRVMLRKGMATLAFPATDYEVVRLLPALMPSEGGMFQYVLRDRRSGHQRIVQEPHIEAAPEVPDAGA